MGAPLHLKVFVSSPGDVDPERNRALALLAELPREPWAAGKLTVEPVMWDDPLARAPMEGGVTPQASVNAYKGRPADCDLTLVLLWGRIGSPPELFRQNGSRFESGTVWEYEDAREAGRTVWLYRRMPPPPIDVEDPQRDDKQAQREGVKRFFAGFRSAEGAALGGFSEFASPEDFAALLHQHLQAYVRQRLDQIAPLPGPEPAGAPAPPYLIPEPSRDHEIVGRGDLLEALWADIAGGANCSLVFLAGVGKTTVALELVRQKARVLEKFEGVLWADLGKRPERMEQLRHWAEALGVAPELMHNLASIEDWKKVVKSAIGARRLLLVLDDVWAVKDARDFAALGPACVTLITTRLPQVAADMWLQGAVVEVEELDESRGLELLAHIAPNAVAADPEGAREMVAAVQGLPLALVLVGKYLRRESGGRDPDRIAEAFATLRVAGERMRLRLNEEEEGGDERTLEEIIDVSYKALPGDAARQALEYLAIFRPKPHAFTKAMALEICGAERSALKQLSDMGLVEHAGGGDYSMHRVIAEYARKKLPRGTAEELHGKALAWYRDRLKEDIEEDLAAYLGWYCYEEPKWQALKDAWLYHLAASGDAVGSILAFLRVYFDAFWWWGYYQRFPFCERLVREWLQRDIGNAQREALRQLSIFQDNYPAGYEKRGRQEDWRKVEKSLIALRQGQGLDGEIARIAGEDARRVRHFTDFFLAECAGYGRGERDLALARYTAAHDQFQGDGTPWIPAWLWFYVAQYLLDAHDSAAAADYTRRALAEAGEEQPLAERDPELLANIYRQLGDLALAAGEDDEAACQYRRAAFYAFIFQAVPEPGDSYTVAFYREITSRIATQVAACHAAAKRRGRELAKALRGYWEPWWQAHSKPGPELDEALKSAEPATLESCLFPAVPTAEKVIEEAGKFAEQVLAVVAPLRAGAAIADDPP
jgi:NB-ARC domain-containing protein